MALIEWNDSWRIGHPVIDNDHMMLVNLTNRLYEVRMSPSNAEIGIALNGLIEYVDRHFTREEEIFGASDYPDKEAHAQRHRDLAQTVRDIAALWRKEPDLLNLDEVMIFLRDWLMKHILKQDMSYRDYVVGKQKRAAA
ncbi:bacteriohemerythrin [Telmatospirillum sp. J64-1]|uniref:bacteriohemerythrin n=1 Tax=Telmatospirillum sp. J64-1 TaxID=2502183 RepID=UPI00115DB840|nr:bacteriohemerythrin [Telmatospirillum sp. J64-1]